MSLRRKQKRYIIRWHYLIHVAYTSLTENKLSIVRISSACFIEEEKSLWKSTYKMHWFFFLYAILSCYNFCGILCNRPTQSITSERKFIDGVQHFLQNNTNLKSAFVFSPLWQYFLELPFIASLLGLPPCASTVIYWLLSALEYKPRPLKKMMIIIILYMYRLVYKPWVLYLHRKTF